MHSVKILMAGFLVCSVLFARGAYADTPAPAEIQAEAKAVDNSPEAMAKAQQQRLVQAIIGAEQVKSNTNRPSYEEKLREIAEKTFKEYRTVELRPKSSKREGAGVLVQSEHDWLFIPLSLLEAQSFVILNRPGGWRVLVDTKAVPRNKKITEGEAEQIKARCEIDDEEIYSAIKAASEQLEKAARQRQALNDLRKYQEQLKTN